MKSDHTPTDVKDCDVTVVDHDDKDREYHVRGMDGLKRLLDGIFRPEQQIGSEPNGAPIILGDAIDELVAAISNSEPTDIDEAMGLSISMRGVPATVSA